MPHIKESKFGVNVIALKKLSKKILGRNYSLSLVLGDKNLSRRLNKTYRSKDKPTNILSFPLDKNEGEIILDIQTIKNEAAAKKKNFRHYLLYIFIHGLLHLKGFAHGSKMEKEEDKIIKSL